MYSYTRNFYICVWFCIIDNFQKNAMLLQQSAIARFRFHFDYFPLLYLRIFSRNFATPCVYYAQRCSSNRWSRTRIRAFPREILRNNCDVNTAQLRRNRAVISLCWRYVYVDGSFISILHLPNRWATDIWFGQLAPAGGPPRRDGVKSIFNARRGKAGSPTLNRAVIAWYRAANYAMVTYVVRTGCVLFGPLRCHPLNLQSLIACGYIGGRDTRRKVRLQFSWRAIVGFT